MAQGCRIGGSDLSSEWLPCSCLDQYLRSWVFIIAQIERNACVTSICEGLWHATHAIFGVLDLWRTHKKNSTFWTSLAFQMSVLERFENPNFSQFWRFWPPLEKSNLRIYFLGFFMKSLFWKPYYLLVHKFIVVGKLLPIFGTFIESLVFFPCLKKAFGAGYKMLNFQERVTYRGLGISMSWQNIKWKNTTLCSFSCYENPRTTKN